MGRPPKDIKRDQQVCIKFTRSERQDIDAQARAAGTSLSEYGRGCMLASQKAAKPSRMAVEALQEQRLIHIQLRRLGNLLNQLVRHMHQSGEILPDVAPILRDLRSIISGRGLP